MSIHEYDIAIAYRVYPKVSKNPVIFKNDKYKLTEFCLKSFRESLGTLHPKIFAILDGCPPEYQDLFRKYFDESDIEFREVDGIGNHATFDLQISILLNQKVSDIIYFAEDDYYYLPGQFREMYNLIKNHPKANFITPYDHVDNYTMDLHTNRYLIIFSGNHHWRSLSSTCLTFMTTKQTLQKTRKEFISYLKGNFDASMWMSLTKFEVLNPLRIMRFVKTSPAALSFVLRAWRYCWIQIIFKKKWYLWAPIPSIATHMEEEFLSPTINKKFLRIQEKE